MNYSQSSGSTIGIEFIQRLDETEKDCKGELTASMHMYTKFKQCID